MTDNSFDIPCGSASGTCGSSKPGNGAGSWLMTVSADGNSFTTSNFQADAIFGTAGGTFVEYGSLNGGTLNATGPGSMTLNPTGRLGSVSNFSSALYNEPWNIPDVNGAAGTTYAPLITGSSTNPNGTVAGSPITSNGDGTYNVVLVSASEVGVDWGGFDGNPYIETWNVNLKPLAVNAAFQASSGKVSRGVMAVAKHSINGYLNYSQVPSPSNSKITKWCIGGCFDFQVTGVLSAQVQVVLLPLTAPIPSASYSPHYWKYFATTKSWKEFVVNSTNSIASAPLKSTGSCPPANDPSYKTGLNSPDKCIRLTIMDNGPNDENGTSGTIADPGGVATPPRGASTTTTTTDFKGLGSGGCALGTDASPWHGGSWWLIGAVIGWLGFSRRRRSPQRS